MANCLISESIDLSTKQDKLFINLYKPTLSSTTLNGVTCVNNNDGSYTFNGTATSDVFFDLGNWGIPNGTYKFTSISKYHHNVQPEVFYGEEDGTWYVQANNLGNTTGLGDDLGDGAVINIIDNGVKIYVGVKKGITLTDLVIKPMVTTNLEATDDDFISYDNSFAQKKELGLQMDLLWENASPSSTFEPQTIALDLTSYKMVGIDFRVINYQTRHLFGLFIKSDAATNFGGLRRAEVYSGNPLYRNIRDIKDDAIRFLEGNRGTTDGTYTNDAMIPVSIYGIK